MTMRPVRLALVLLATILGSSAVTAAEPPSSDLAAVTQRGVLRMVCFPHQDSEFVAVNLAAGPMAKNGTAASFVGADVDIMAGFAEELGVGLVVHPVAEPSYGALIPALLAGEGDVIASSLTITEERRGRVAFSQAYHRVHPVVLARAGRGLASADDLAGLTAATIPGSSQEEMLKGLGFTADRLRAVSFTRDGLLAVTEGEADVVVVDSNAANRMLPEFPGLAVAFRLPGEEDYGFAVRPGSDLLPQLDAYLEKLAASGRLAEIKRRHKIPVE